MWSACRSPEILSFSFFFLPARMASNQGESSATGLHPLTDRKEYETQYFGFTPKSFVDGGK